MLLFRIVVIRINFWFSPISLLRPGDYDYILGSRDRQIGHCLPEEFPSAIEKRVHRFFAGELLLVFKCVIDV